MVGVSGLVRFDISRGKGKQTMTRDPIELGLPDKVEFYNRGSHIEIVRKWFGWQILFLTAFAVFWNGFLVNWYTRIPEDADLMAVLFPLIHVGVGVGLTYYVVAGWFNRTHILVSHRKLAVQHTPVPWFGNKEISASELQQVYAKEKISHSRNGTTVTYEVHAITHRGRNTKLVGGLESSEQALFIEQEIEKYLSIIDAPVKGEFGGSLS